MKKAPPGTIEYRSCKSFNANTFIQVLNNVPWHVVESESDINSAVLMIMWNKLFCDIADAHAPVKRRRVKCTQVPWMNSKISEAMQDKRLPSSQSRKVQQNLSLEYVQKIEKLC